MNLRDKYGYPIEVVSGRHIYNFIRLWALTDIRQTFKRRDQKITSTNNMNGDGSNVTYVESKSV